MTQKFEATPELFYENISRILEFGAHVKHVELYIFFRGLKIHLLLRQIVETGKYALYTAKEITLVNIKNREK